MSKLCALIFDCGFILKYRLLRYSLQSILDHLGLKVGLKPIIFCPYKEKMKEICFTKRRSRKNEGRLEIRWHKPKNVRSPPKAERGEK